MNMTILWFILALVLFAIEAATVGLVCIWFGIGALVSMLSSFVIDNIYIQWIIFIIVALSMLIFIRPLMKKTILENTEKTNVSSLINKTAFLTEEINEEKNGRVKFSDISWIAVSQGGETIKEGEKVRVIDIKGNKLVVERV